MKKILSYLIPLILLATIAYLAFKSFNQYQIVREKGETIIGTVTTIGGNVICKFKVNGENKSIKLSKPNKDIRSGEKFQVYYYDKVPDKYYVSFAEPVFDTINYKKISAQSFELVYDDILFKYFVDKEYERYQDSDKFTNEKIAQSKSLPVVYYNKLDPRLAYIIFE